jgi:hypothetical protein
MGEEHGDINLSNVQRQVTPAFLLNHIGRHAFERAAEGEKGRTLETVTALLMCALAIEAVLNHVGEKLFAEDAGEPAVWGAIERLGPRRKLEAIGERCGLQVDFGRTPYQQFKHIFDFRNDLVHAKTQTVCATDLPYELVEQVSGLDSVPELQAEWEQKCDLETAAEWRAAVAELSVLLCKSAGCVDPLRVGYITDFRGEAVSPE